MASLFSKALVYLGLVDEDPSDPDARFGSDPRRGDEDGSPGRREPAWRPPAHEHRDEEDRENAEQIEHRRPEPRRGEARRVETVSRVEGRRVEPPSSASRTTSFRTSGDHDPSSVRAMRSIDIQADILVVEEFGDAKILADRVRDRVPVVLDLRHTDPDLVRRVIDFASGLIYAIDGTMTKIGEAVVAVLPPRVVLSRDEQRRLQRLGVYQLADEA
jgi:cell division inhibitor SepF